MERRDFVKTRLFLGVVLSVPPVLQRLAAHTIPSRFSAPLTRSDGLPSKVTAVLQLGADTQIPINGQPTFVADFFPAKAPGTVRVNGHVALVTYDAARRIARYRRGKA